MLPPSLFLLIKTGRPLPARVCRERWRRNRKKNVEASPHCSLAPTLLKTTAAKRKEFAREPGQGSCTFPSWAIHRWPFIWGNLHLPQSLMAQDSEPGMWLLLPGSYLVVITSLSRGKKGHAPSHPLLWYRGSPPKPSLSRRGLFPSPDASCSNVWEDHLIGNDGSIKCNVLEKLIWQGVGRGQQKCTSKCK